jgi:hypothetical protein
VSDCICLGACFGPNGTPDTWAELVAAERALADDLADELDKIDRDPWSMFSSEAKAHRKRLLARYREARGR